MRETPDENRDKTLRDFETFLRGQVHANYENPQLITNTETVMGFYGKVNPDEALKFLESDACWERIVAEISDVIELKEAWNRLRRELIAAFAEKRVWKEWRGIIREKFKNFKKRFLRLN